MSSPMFELPEHLMIGLTKDNQGPAFDYEIDHWACWCGDPACTKWKVADETN